jgi:hypothetical protein
VLAYLIRFLFLTVSQLGDARYKEAKSLGYHKPILRMLKVDEVHSDDECPPGGDARKNRGLLIAEKPGRNEIMTALVREMDTKILRCMECSASRKKKSIHSAVDAVC